MDAQSISLESACVKGNLKNRFSECADQFDFFIMSPLARSMFWTLAQRVNALQFVSSIRVDRIKKTRDCVPVFVTIPLRPVMRLEGGKS
jgi:hypothetical protein